MPPRAGYRANSRGVIWLTSTSVVCADSTVATTSSNGLRKSSSAWAEGYFSAKARLIRRARSFDARSRLPDEPAAQPGCLVLPASGGVHVTRD